MNRWIIKVFVSAAILIAAGCAATGPYLYNDTNLVIRLADSDYHSFSYVRVYRDGDVTVLYGKVQHHHRYCTEEGHVDLALTDSDGKAGRTESARLRLTSSRRHGSSGAAFRFRLAPVPARGSSLLLAFHDDGCGKGPRNSNSLECGDNRAARTVPASGIREGSR